MKKSLKYVCPMHPEVTSDHPGTCSKCGMDLVSKGSLDMHHNHSEGNSYTPLVVVVGLILLITSVLSLRDFWGGVFTFENSIMYFMAMFFVVFAGFKLVDLRGFAQGYRTYDILAKRWPAYGYIYPFIELFFGITMILGVLVVPVLWLEIIVMTFSGIGVAIKLSRHERFQCACLGTFLKVPLTKVTLIEDFGMALLAATLLLQNYK